MKMTKVMMMVAVNDSEDHRQMKAQKMVMPQRKRQMKVTIMKVMVMAAKHGGREDDGCDENNDGDSKEAMRV